MINYVFSISGSYFYWYRGFVRFTEDINEAELFDTEADIEDFLSSENYEKALEIIGEFMSHKDAPIVIKSIIKEI